MADVFDLIAQWAHDRNLIEGSTPHAQMLKFFEEGGELAGGVARQRIDKIKDGIGDCVVCLTILARQHGLDVRDCIAFAYDEIKDRKGRMVDGIFIKEEDGYDTFMRQHFDEDARSREEYAFRNDPERRAEQTPQEIAYDTYVDLHKAEGLPVLTFDDWARIIRPLTPVQAAD